MDTNKMRDISREQFEQRYPVPEGACWNAEQARYVLFHLKLCTVAKYERFVENWVCWQASRDAVAVNPAWPDHYDYTNSDVAGAAVLDCRSAFQKAMRAQGLKVAP
ncbi:MULTISPECIES: hypothetical protein [Pseudomonas]|uniref:hypothetical protein n=1 Tax=Pseudomonas TaxID=286 RepID=UPI001F277BBC|nr:MULTISPECIES: hypothetical protein [Pseudomonas]UJW24776.1 hypothetical protein L2Y89_11605 [Pseudomonas juntendi]